MVSFLQFVILTSLKKIEVVEALWTYSQSLCFIALIFLCLSLCQYQAIFITMTLGHSVK